MGRPRRRRDTGGRRTPRQRRAGRTRWPDGLGLRDDDLLVVLAGAPVSTYDDLVTVLRVLGTLPGEVRAEWVRDGVLQTSLTGNPARQS